MRRLKKYLLWTFGTLFALFIALSAFVYFAILKDENKIKNIVIAELNKSLTGEVSVERMSLTFWSSFPQIALDFKNVKATGSNPADTVPLLKARNLSLNFNLRYILAKKYEVNQIEMSGAVVCIKHYADGSENYALWKSAPASDSSFSFALKKIHFKNTELCFINERSEQRYELYFYRANARGDFSENLQDISLSGDLFVDLIQLNQTTVLSKKSASLRTQLSIDNATQTVRFLDGYVRLEDLDFDLLGFVNYSDDAPNMDLEITGKHLSINKLAKQLPPRFAKEIKKYQSSGNFDFQLRLSNNLRNCQLQIQNFSALVANSHLAGNLTIRNFQSPSVWLNTAFSLRLEDLTTFVPIPEIEKITGSASGKIQYQRTFKSIDSIRVSEVLNGPFQGEIWARNVFCKLQDTILKPAITLDSAEFRFNQNHLQIPMMHGVFADCKFQASSLFLPDFFKHLQTPEKLDISGDLSVDRYQIDNVLLKNLSGSIHYQNQILSVDKFFVNAIGGSVSGFAEIDCSDMTLLPFRFDGQVSHINAEKLFADFDNFGQTEITDKNLKGTIDAELSVFGKYSPTTGLDSKSLWVTMKTKISNGELNNVSMLQKLSRFVDEETLNHVKFATLENTIQIQDEVITLPEMRINSNALNINVSGTHHFDGNIDYSIKIALSDLLSKRRRERRQNQVESGALDDEKKRTSLYVFVSGTLDNPKFRYDIKNVFRNLELGSAAIKKERDVAKKVLKEEFQFLQKSEETKRQEALWREQEKGKFVIEWDENKPETPVDTKKTDKRPTKKDTVRIGVLFEDD